jgi:hypothetical protein
MISVGGRFRKQKAYRRLLLDIEFIRVYKHNFMLYTYRIIKGNCVSSAEPCIVENGSRSVIIIATKK